MWIAIILITAIWLLLAPAVLSFSTPALLGSVLSGLLVTLLLFLRRRDDSSVFWIAMVGLYNIIAGLGFGGEGHWNAVIAGVVLLAAGLMALRTTSCASPQPGEGHEAPAQGSTVGEKQHGL